jgi:hypothetical protein
MKTMPWRILVLSDAGVDSGLPLRVPEGGVDAWMAAIGASAEIPGPSGSRMRWAPSGRESFSPQGLRSSLGPGDERALDAVLHDAAFQRVESAWRGLSLLAAEAGDAVIVEAASVPRRQLVAGFRRAVLEPETPPDSPPSLILLDFDFSHRPDDLAVLSELASMAKIVQAPIVAHASAGFFGVRYLVQAASLPSLLDPLAAPTHASWRAFQATEPARWVALTLNRYLQRDPYTRDAGGHAEVVGDSHPDSYLWGRGVWLVGAAVARSVRAHGHGFDVAGAESAKFSGLAARPWAATANEGVALAAEVPLAEMQVVELSRAAFTPVVGVLRTSAVFLPIVVTASRLSPGKLTLEGTLAYQVMAGRLAQFCGRLLDEMPAGPPADVARWIREELVGFMGALAGDSTREAVTVEPREAIADEGRVPVAEVRIRPAITLEGKEPQFEFALPLRS